MMNPTMRAAEPGDAPALAALARAAFCAAFGHFYAPADLAAFLAETKTPERFAAALTNPACRIQLCDLGGNLAAYCLIVLGRGYSERPDPRPQRPVTLGQLYCEPALTGRGLGAALCQWAIADAREWGADAVQLSVYSENFAAQRFYQRHGFVHVADTEFWVGSHCDHEFLYELAL